VIPVTTPGEYGKVKTVPPSVADQPANVYPAWVGAVGAEAIDPPVVKDPEVTAVPPFESYVTVCEFPVQIANNVTVAELGAGRLEPAMKVAPPHTAPTEG
jgi:hypothetical protein